MGVGGAEREVLVIEVPVMPGGFESDGTTGKASHVEVTSSAFSTARRYLPIYL